MTSAYYFNIKAMRYAIIGTGHVGQALATSFARQGIEVAFASRRSPEALTPVAQAIGPTSLPDALQADVILLAMPFRAYQQIAQATASWQGKTVIDVTNAYGVSPEELGHRPSSAVIAAALPGASLVKAFNHLPAAVLAEDPRVNGGRRVLFLSGDDAQAVATVAGLVEQLGFAPINLGQLTEGGLLIQVQGNNWAPLIFQDLFKK
ncbi:MAG: NADPH-dependent F420 reductase [Janthinobacterium lividum]